MVAEFTIICAISTKDVSSNPVHGELYYMQHNVIMFVSDWRKIDGFQRALQFSPTMKLPATVLLKYC